MFRPHITCILAALALSHVAHAANRPDTSAFETAMEQRLQKLKPGDYTERNVHFVSVEQGKEQGGAYAFRATIAIRDYGPGYPANRYYGQTCVGKLVDQVYWMSPDGFGGWKVEGAMTPDTAHRTCKNNPAAGASSMPVEALEGKPARMADASTSRAPSSDAAAPVRARNSGGSGTITSGEWACYGAGGRALIGLGFRVNPDGTYTDLDGKSRGRYAADASSGTLTFTGGHLGGQVGRAMGQGRYNIGTTTCEPNR